MHSIAERVFEIQKHKQQATERADDATHVPDFVDVLLQKPFQDGQPLPDYNITLVVIDMLIAGTETIATTVEWAIAELVSHPNTVQRLQDELDTVVGSSQLIVEADFPNLPYLQAVIKETFRLHPPAVLNLPRESTQAFEFRGYRFPKQTRLIINQFAVHRDPRVYENPDGFEPERFLVRPESNHLSGFEYYELMPFSMGRLAFFLGNVMVESTLAHLMHSLRWALPVGTGTVDARMFYPDWTVFKWPGAAILS